MNLIPKIQVQEGFYYCRKPEDPRKVAFGREDDNKQRNRNDPIEFDDNIGLTLMKQPELKKKAKYILEGNDDDEGPSTPLTRRHKTITSITPEFELQPHKREELTDPLRKGSSLIVDDNNESTSSSDSIPLARLPSSYDHPVSFQRAMPRWSKLMRISCLWVPPGSSRLPIMISRTLWTALCPFLILFEFFLPGGQFGIVTSLIFVFLVLACVSLWFSSIFYYNSWFEAHLLSATPLRKRERCFKGIESKLFVLSLGPYAVILCAGCALVALKYLTGSSSQRYLFGVYLLYAPYCWFIIAGLITNLMVCDLLQVIVNDILQIIQTEEIKSWTCWLKFQLHLKIIRKKVEAACYHLRLYTCLVMTTSVIFIVSFGNLILGLPAEIVTLITDMLLFALSILLMFTILYPGTSVTDRTEKCVKYGNISIASRWFLLRSSEALTYLKYIEIGNVQFKCYGMSFTRLFLMKAMVLTISFMFISFGRLDFLFN